MKTTPESSWPRAAKEADDILANMAGKSGAAASDLLQLLEDALPYVEESEQFNKPTRRGLSKRIRAAIAKGESQ